MPRLRAALSLVRRGVVLELRLYRSLARWLARRPDIPESTEPFGYARMATPVIWLWIFGSAVEIPVAHLLIPWEGARITALVLGVWGLLWMVGMLASLHIHPHLLSDTTLRVRNGASVDIAIPWDRISTLRVQRRDLPSSVWTLQPRETESGVNLQVGVSGEVNVHAALTEPTTVSTHKGEMEITQLSFLADDPRDLAARARQIVLGEVSTSGRARQHQRSNYQL